MTISRCGMEIQPGQEANAVERGDRPVECRQMRLKTSQSVLTVDEMIAFYCKEVMAQVSRMCLTKSQVCLAS